MIIEGSDEGPDAEMTRIQRGNIYLASDQGIEQDDDIHTMSFTTLRVCYLHMT